jgi:hypothetical protein
MKTTVMVAKVLAVCAGLGLVVLAVSAVLLGSGGEREGDEMVGAAVDEDGGVQIPPIDAAAPGETATATFALG